LGDLFLGVSKLLTLHQPQKLFYFGIKVSKICKVLEKQELPPKLNSAANRETNQILDFTQKKGGAFRSYN